MEKLELIKRITEFHPAYEPGRKRGWSHYVGGMADTGDWYFRKLMDASEEELQQCLNELEEIENAPDPIYTEEELSEMKQYVMIAPGIHSNAYQVKQMKKLMEEKERRMLWGKRK